ncbi:biotin synthase BioB [Dechloromonas sp. XY25]|uniref:Biotin synthase n=1 Tax=Dechloromonas hankyongensis TaxID=2908002 RepID=A0ABS9K1V8_9RHOO|nr:biotin synthase BioB [Dechloromonas hankyongensis]MCG2577143.1 biotin synthase BioB [Dechloromonas hankyongensis]
MHTQTCAAPVAPLSRRQWSVEETLELFEKPFMDLLWQAQLVHRIHFDANHVQRSALFSIKTGGCSEDCKYCSQSARHNTAVEREPLKPLAQVLAAAHEAKEKGASRFCMGAAWRNPKDKDLDAVLEMVHAVKALGLETCLTLGMLKPGQAERLKEAGLDFYNHNLDTAPEHYAEIVSTHCYADRLDTLDQVRAAGIKICSGGIVGMGETQRHRAGLLAQFANMPRPPESVPINHLVAIPGSPLADLPKLDSFEFVRTIAVARILMPKSYVRLSAGRQEMSDELQALCFLAGANSIFYGSELLTTGNYSPAEDDALFQRLGLIPA